MSGWIDWHEAEVLCPFCNRTINILFVEEGSTDPGEGIIHDIAGGETTCPCCNSTITYKYLRFNHTED